MPSSPSIVKALQHMMDMQAIASILDLGCGKWSFFSELNLSGVHYLGLDRDADCIRYNLEQFHQPHILFEQRDIRTELPQRRFDLVLARDVFCEISERETIEIINHLKHSGSHYLAISSDHRQKFTAYDPAQAAQPNGSAINWRHAPYFFPAPLLSMAPSHDGLMLDVWRLSDLPIISLEDATASGFHGGFTASEISQMEFIRQLSQLDYIDRIGLYGSRMLGTFTADSDFDIMLYCSKPLSAPQWQEICEILARARTPQEIDCKVFCPGLRTILDEYEYHMANMVTLYEKQHYA